ncbi:HEPN domain-containing protein [Halomarina halobia]|uniref:HEPN domain-containing protein n=1 Tax=Halomarina halobia TaxID=3033386 RepID=A0ABD6A9Y8_9EURY|nr:HEPN domain-containing protein [Halomarina sp. PSR21]
MPDDEEGPEEAAVEDQLRQANRALADAEGARNAELSDAVVINRLYYACFHAAQAVLYDRSHNPGSHGGVLSLFGSEVVVAGDVPRERGRFLNDLSELRKRADYGYGRIDDDVDALLARTQQFVSEMEDLCTSRD